MKILIITILILLISVNSFAASINGIPVANILSGPGGDGTGIYLLYNFTFTFLMKYAVAPIALFKCVLCVLESTGE